MMKEGYIDLEYLDESGFCAWGEVSYSHSKKGEQKRLEQPKKRAKRLNIIGVLKKEESFEYSFIEGKFDSEIYIKFMDVLAERAAQKFKETGRITVLAQDNISVHKSKLSQAQWYKWHKMGLWLFFLPPYCSELNAIEVEWHQIKAHEICGIRRQLTWPIASISLACPHQGTYEGTKQVLDCTCIRFPLP
jgi:putative transposase